MCWESLAKICAFENSEQTSAVAICIDRAANSEDLPLANNTNMSKETVTHLENV